MTCVKIRSGDSIDKALRILKKKLDKEGVMRTVKAHRFYEKPSVKRKEKSKAALRFKKIRRPYAPSGI
ncbi:MAG: 30S ribosomal protein S21 [Chlamydiae bacterium GWC2_50_10]|nr:MAG: 30S ribosomal protein S21 [Chlamydiae bacterium GWA2_50_15]OGN54040.1 MAG: 30S ribosomal protein S21 [Chlamydiae bacterium GWC2_50_10]OGN57419.1 MAG: 30S ribosomal protein S21 [Chlamydiae bacterium RIFCSPHIGHO2_02_FULL_49_29]OGN68338.1 MAG: 30S ribosomal protein S21 [Chlamydiae bacterium RIFCSPLOWO2_02_FULL_49_12]OGN72332.1 MAG: 30S ribosomal protein S21 [Chlamydiae bacterium RIFCSPLOWO2_12_FULL_49_12]HAZ15339.1 30S ribosomal protein S21 [Parachlamydiales bacterium]